METTGHYRRPSRDTAPFSIFCKTKFRTFLFLMVFFLFVFGCLCKVLLASKASTVSIFASLFILVYETSINCKNINKKA